MQLGAKEKAGREGGDRKAKYLIPHQGRGWGESRPQRSPGKGCPTPSRLLLEVDVGTDQHVIEKEDPALLGLDQLPSVSVHRLRQSLTQKQLPLARG